MRGADGGPARRGVILDALQHQAEIGVANVVGLGEPGFEHVAFAGVEPELAVEGAARLEAQRFALQVRLGAGVAEPGAAEVAERAARTRRRSANQTIRNRQLSESTLPNLLTKIPNAVHLAAVCKGCVWRPLPSALA